jgi:ABC-type multidrug transport system fused ATPase/permease subunit
MADEKESKTIHSVINRSIYSWIFPGNLRNQIIIVVLVGLTIGARLLPLEMQKRIVNEAISLGKMDLLYIYCAMYLGAVIAASGLKLAINILQTYVAQHTLARMRNQFYAHILTLPLSFFRKTQPGMVVNALVTELAAAGTFVGQSVALPLINLGTLLAFAGYLLYLNWLLALVSMSIYPLAILILPMLQKRVNRTNKKRVDISRTTSDQIAESVTGIHEVHGNASYSIENDKFGSLVQQLFKVRVIWTIWQQLVKTSNNFFTNLGPFFIFLLGGYLAMQGQLELGSLVAFLSAQEKLYEPWRELIAFYQTYQTALVQYDKTREYFEFEPEYSLTPKERTPKKLEASLEVENVSYKTSDGIRLLENIDLTLDRGQHLALVGFSGSGKSTLAQCVGQLYKYTSGTIRLGGEEVSELTKADMAANMGYVAQYPFIFTGTIEENLLYGCESLVENKVGDREEVMPSLDQIISMLQQTGVFADVLRFGLNALLDREKDADMVKRIASIRKDFQAEFGEELAEYVEFFSEDKFLYHSNIAENLTFGTALKPEFEEENLVDNQYFINFLAEADLTRPLLNLGAELAVQTVDILGNLSPDKVFFEQSPFAANELERYRAITESLRKKKLHQLSDAEQTDLLRLALRFNPGRHKMIGLPSLLESLVLEGRALFREKIETDHPDAYSFWSEDKYISSQTILNNILFGKTKTNKPQAQEKINHSIIQLLIEEDLLETMVQIGMQFQVGSKGENLSGGQRQKLAITRAFLKAPPLLIMDEATSGLDNKSQARIQNQLETKWKGRTTLIAVVHRLDITKNYDKIALMKAGKIVEMGTYDELMAKKGTFYELVIGKK